MLKRITNRVFASAAGRIFPAGKRQPRTIIAAGLAASAIVIGLTLAFVPGIAASEPSGADKGAAGTDVTAAFRSLNADDTGALSAAPRSGNAQVKGEGPAAKKTAVGFEIQLGQTNVPSPVVSNGILYSSGGFGSREYYAFDARTGKKIWAVSLDDDGPSSAAIADGVIVFNTESCTIFGCRAADGALLWSYWLGDPLMSMPAIAHGIVFTAYPAGGGKQVPIDRLAPTTNPKEKPDPTFVNGTHVLIAIDLHSGKILWRKWIDSDVMSAPVASGDELYVSTFSGTLLKFRQRTGEILSARAIRATSAPVIRGKDIIVSRRSDREGEKVSESIANYAATDMAQTREYNKRRAPYLDAQVQAESKLKSSSTQNDAGNGFSGGAPASSGWEKANANVGQSNVSSLQSFQGSRSLVFRGATYNTMGDELVRADAATGAVRWKLKLDGDLAAAGGFIGTPPLAAGNRIVLAGYNGDVSIHDPETGKILKRYKIDGHIRYQPVVASGWIYATTDEGKLIAVNTGDITLTGWNMWGANAARTNQAE